MDKIITCVVMLFSFVVWFATDGTARANSRRQRPEIKAAMAAQAASDQASAAAATAANEAAAQKQRDTLLPQFGSRSGIMGVTENGKDLRYGFSVKLAQNGPADMDPTGWKARVTIFDLENPYTFAALWAKPVVNGNEIQLVLQEADKRQLFNGSSSMEPSQSFTSMTFKLENGTWSGVAEGGYKLSWAMKPAGMDKTVADSFAGMWEGKMGDGKVTFSLSADNGDLAGPITYEGMFTCKGAVRAVPFGADAFFLVIGSLPGATNCPADVTIKLAVQGDKMTAAAYDRLSNDPSILSFTKK